MFDADLILMDGTVVSTTSTHTAADPAIIASIDATTGAAVVDIGETGVYGLVAVMFCSDLLVGADNYTLTAYLQASDTLDMTSATDIERLASFGVANATTGVILGSETPCVATARFATKKRYVRVNYAVSNDFGYIKCYLTPWPFKVL